MKTPEARIKETVRKYLKSIGAYRFSPVQMGIGQSTLDDLCCIKGRFVGIEYKAPGKQPTLRQALIMAQINSAGGPVIWGDNADDIIAAIKDLFNATGSDESRE
jgi:hypothetical protein